VIFSDAPPPPEVVPGQDEPAVRVRPPGPQSRSWLVRHAHCAAPMGPRPASSERGPGAIVLSTGKGSNVFDVDGNRYVDLAAGFGAQLAGHCHPSIVRVLELQSTRLLQALGDVYPADAKIGLLERLSKLFPTPGAKAILSQSGSDAVDAALKTALLATGKPGVLAFSGAYHGLGYGPLAACDLRPSYREPFAAQLNPHVRLVAYPRSTSDLDATLERARLELSEHPIGAVLVEPILGRGGVVVAPPAFLPELGRLAKAAGALVIADEIWTGLGRSGRLLYSASPEFCPDLVCLGKGLGGGLPLSAVLGPAAVLDAWQRDAEVVHTSTFSGAPLACATAIALLELLGREGLVERSAALGERFQDALDGELEGGSVLAIRGAGLMIGIELASGPGSAARLQRALLERGYVTSTGGGAREVLVLTPPLNVAEPLLFGVVPVLADCIRNLAGAKSPA
jgi:4-aminobutyrate aminotransferase/(S)-3-amino-2-methylpropionate transaminase